MSPKPHLGKTIGQAVSIRTNVDEEKAQEAQKKEVDRWGSEWSGEPVFTDQMAQGEQNLHWRFAGSEAVAVDVLDKDGMATWNEWLAKTFPEGAPKYMVEQRPEPYVVGTRLIQYALFRKIEYRRLLKSKPLAEQRSINDPDTD